MVQLGGPGTWEDWQVFFQSVVRTVIGGDSGYLMLYSGDDSTKFRTGRATSADGVHWQKDPRNPVLDAGSSPSDWNYWGSWVPRVMWNGSQYMMWFNGAGGFERFGPGARWQMGVARSADGNSWVVDSNSPLDLTNLRSWWAQDWHGIAGVIFDGTTYRTWYEGGAGSYSAYGLATSTDGIHWEKSLPDPVLAPGDAGEWDYQSIGYAACVIQDSGLYILWYTGRPTLNLDSEGIGFAVSRDGVHWKKYPHNPVLTAGDQGSWDEDVLSPSVILDGSIFRMWYSGTTPSGPQIGYATAPKSPATIELSMSSVNFQNVIAGTVSDTVSVAVSNWGFTPLTVTSIAHSSNEFALPDLPALPLTIPPFDEIELKVSFRPAYAGLRVTDTVTIASDDTQHPRSTVALRGRGKGAVLPASPNTLYAVRGNRLYTVERSDGRAAEHAALSPDPPPDLQCLTFRRSDSGLYGAYSTRTQTFLYHISSEFGDFDSAGLVPLGDITAIAFNEGDSLYLADSKQNLFVAAGINGFPAMVGRIGARVSSLAFDPATHELWGSAHDTLCRINIATGETHFVVVSVPGIRSSAITFDPVGTMYGMFESALGIVTNPLIGRTVIIGPTVVEGLRAIAMQNTVPTDLPVGEHFSVEAELSQNYPNPFNPSTTIEYVIPRSGFVTLKVYNTLGEEIETLVSEEQAAGRLHAKWDAAGFPSGVYFYRLTAGAFVETRRMVLTK